MFGFAGFICRESDRDTYGSDPTKDASHHMRVDRLKQIRIYHERVGGEFVDDVTWNDLDMDAVFFRINHTASYIGEQMLYHRLHCSTEEKDWDQYEEFVSLFDQDKELRQRIEKRLHIIGRKQTAYYMTALLSCFTPYPMAWMALFRILQIALIGMLGGWLIYASNVCRVLFLLVIGVNLILYIREKQKAESMLTCLDEVCSLLEFCGYLKKDKKLPKDWFSPEFEEDVCALHPLRILAGRFVTKKQLANLDPQGLISDYLLGITLWDLTSFNKITEIIQDHEVSILRLFEFAGNLDMAISIGSFRRSLDRYCLPEFSDGEQIKVKGLFHPLVENAVPNSIVLNQFSMMMGANASGKSTFLKALAVNMILAQTIHTCSAEVFCVLKMKVMTSMAVRDDVQTGESYYVREIKYLKRMLDEAVKEKPVLCVIDEILKGTNQKERLAASEAILRFLSGTNCFLMAATHDLELIYQMSGIFDCYHFRCLLSGDGIKFSYRIYRGVGGDTNAIALLDHFHFPKEVIEFAQGRIRVEN